MLTPEIRALNNRLIDRYGLSHDGRPKFKLAWSEDCLEYRYSKIAKYDEHGNYLGEQRGVSQQKKWNWIKNRWLLCRLFDGPKEQGDIHDWDGYECVFNFDNHGEYLPPTWNACEFICETLLKILPTTPQEAKNEAAEQEAREIETNRQGLEEAGKLFEGKTVGYTGKEFSK